MRISKKKPILTIAALTIGIIAVVGILAITTKMGMSSFNKPITAFAIGSDVAELKQNDFKTSAKIAQGETLRLQMRYDPKKVRTIKAKLLGTNGKTALDAGSYKVGKNGDFSVAMNTDNLKPGNYTAKVTDQDNQQIFDSKLTVTKKDK